MKMTDEAKRAIEDLYYRLDVIYDEITAPDFVEIIGTIGGDVERYRVYEDGSTYVK